jgi:hypothetical protein
MTGNEGAGQLGFFPEAVVLLVAVGLPLLARHFHSGALRMLAALLSFLAGDTVASLIGTIAWHANPYWTGAVWALLGAIGFSPLLYRPRCGALTHTLARQGAVRGGVLGALDVLVFSLVLPPPDPSPASIHGVLAHYAGAFAAAGFGYLVFVTIFGGVGTVVGAVFATVTEE